jgi:hypothetical protein
MKSLYGHSTERPETPSQPPVCVASTVHQPAVRSFLNYLQIFNAIRREEERGQTREEASLGFFLPAANVVLPFVLICS